MSSIEPNDGGSEIDRAKERLGAFIVTGRDASELLEFGEEILDQVSGLIQFFVITPLLASVCPWRNDALNA